MTTKAEKIAELEKLNVPLTGEEKVSDLDALLEKHAAPADPASGEAVPPAGQVPASEVDSVDVIKVEQSGGRQYIRTYSLERHGEDFQKLAAQYAAKYSKDPGGATDPARNHVVVPSTEVSEVFVQYREKEDFEKPLKDQNPDAPFVDKERAFTDKEAALDFNLQKKGTIVVAR